MTLENNWMMTAVSAMSLEYRPE
jgi:hypothetical protein